MPHAIYFARFARCGAPALVLCSGLKDIQQPPIGDVAVIMPGEDAQTVHRSLYASERNPWGTPDQTKDDPAEQMLALAKMQAEVELEVLLRSESATTRVALEPYDPVELARWRMLGHFADLQKMVPQLESPELASELRQFNRLSSVRPGVPSSLR